MKEGFLDRLAKSDAAESLRMEQHIAQCFKKLAWPASQSVHYQDPITQKSREVDVLSSHFLDRPRRYKGIGAPIINVHHVCECKSLSGTNAIVVDGVLDWPERDRTIEYWIGYSEFLSEAASTLASSASFPTANRSAIYSYFSQRAYPDERAIAFELSLNPPAHKYLAGAFRETKAGDLRRSSEGRSGGNPLWSAIQSVLSAAEAVRLHSISRLTEMIDSFAEGAFDVESFAFSFDAELLRRVLIRPVVFCRARLLRLDGNKINDIDSIRLSIRGLSSEHKFVDIVHIDAAEAYIQDSAHHFEASSKVAIKKVWTLLEEIDWQPGSAHQQLAEATGVAPRRRKPR